jgi:hypothetical protein
MHIDATLMINDLLQYHDETMTFQSSSVSNQLSYGQVRSMKKHRIINQLHTTDKNETN